MGGAGSLLIYPYRQHLVELSDGQKSAANQNSDTAKYAWER